MKRWNHFLAHAPILLMVLSSFFASTSTASAQAPVVAEIAELRMKVRQQQAKEEVAKWELNTSANKLPEDYPAQGPDFGRLLSAAFQLSYVKVPKTISGGGLDASLEESWKQAEARRIEFLRAVATREATFGFNWANRTPPRFQLGLFDLMLVGWSLIALGVSMSLAVHERRRSIRQGARARLPGGVAAVLAIGLFFQGGCRGPDGPSGDPELRALEDEKKALQSQLADVTNAAADSSKFRDGRYRKRVEDWMKLVDPGTRTTLEQADLDLVSRIRAAAERAALEDKLAIDVMEVVENAGKEQELLDLTSSARWWLIAFAGLRVAAAVVLGGIAATPFWLARRKSSAELKVSARTCPKCLAVGKLAIQKVQAGGSSGYTEGTYLECRAKDSEGNECGNRIARSHQYVPRLCFPTVGIRSSGKTHMLTTAYSAIHNRKVPTSAAVQPAPSVMDERFREYIKLILRDRGETGATVMSEVDPLLIHSRDIDKWGQNGVLVNLFDYSGELLEEDNPLARELRPRALKMDGFMMFFDPTQIYGDNGVTLEDQIRNLASFYQEMAEARGLPPGTLIPNPVAICITKFDLLESQNPIGGQCLPFIQQLDGALKPNDNCPVTLSMLKARSDLVEQMLPLMFPGVDLGRLVREYFGNQMLYFPMSSVNLNLDEFGRVDTSSRNPAPYGVVEPILWLMHMHGYCVLEG